MARSGPRVSSPRNPRVQRVRKLHRRSFRTAESAFLVEGPVPVLEGLRAGLALQEVFVDPDAPEAPEVREAARFARVPVVEASRSVMEAASGTATPQGILAVAEMPPHDLEVVPERATLVLVLAGVADPGNAGTLLRSAVAAACDAVIFLEGSVDPFGPKTVRASAGAVLHTRVVRDAAWSGCRALLQDRGLRTVGSAARARVPLDEADLRGPAALVVGNEAAGLGPELLEDLDEVISIPMPGPVESLNAAVAGSILLFEAVRQRRRAADRPVSSDDG